MLNSWFGTRPDNDKPTDPARRSTDLQRTTADPSELPHESPLKPERHTPPAGFASPHDAVLAEMHGQPAGTDPLTDQGSEDLLRNDATLQVNEPFDGPAPSPVSTTNHAVPREVVYDPFDGTPVAYLPAPERPSPPIQHREEPPTKFRQLGSTSQVQVGEGNKEEDLWMHLSRVVDLQNQVARMHLDVEGVGAGKTGDGKGKSRGWGKGKTEARERRDWRENEGEKGGQEVADEDAPEGDGDEEGVEVVGDEEAEIKRAREEEFAKLADQFEGRKESINEIMDRVSASFVLPSYLTLLLHSSTIYRKP